MDAPTRRPPNLTVRLVPVSWDRVKILKPQETAGYMLNP